MHWIFLSFLVLSFSVMAAGEMPVTFTLTGRLFESPTSANPLIEQNVELRVQILNSTKTCVLYDQKQIIHTDTTDGNFAIDVGSVVGDSKRVSGSDRGNEMSAVFQNTAPIPATCGGASTNASAVSRAGRHLRVSVKPPGQLEDVLTPDIFVGHVPTALVSETLGGLSKDQFLQLGSGTSELTQSNLETIFSSTKFPVLEGLVAGTTTIGGINSNDNYVITANADSVGTGMIQFAIGSSVKAEITNAGDFIANQKIGVGTGLPSFDLAFGGSAGRTIGIERGSGAELKISSGGAAAGSSNSAGGDLVLSSGLSTGTGGSRILFQTPTPGGADNNPVTKMILDTQGQLGINNISPNRPLHISSSGSPTILLDYSTGGVDQKRRFITSSSDGALSFGKFSDNMGTTSEHLRILSNGRVGIGKTDPSSDLDVNGTAIATRVIAGGAPVVAWSPVTKTSSYSVTSSDVYKYFLVSGTSTMTLPSPSAVGAGYTIGFNNVGSGTVTINPNTSETINGGANYAMSAGGAVTLITDGVSWFFFNQKLPPCTDNTGNLSPCTTVANRYVTATAGGDITSWSNSVAGTSVTASIPTGYYSGKTVTFTEPELTPSSIRTGYTVFGVTGNGSTAPSTGQVVSSISQQANPTASSCTSPACPSGFSSMGCWIGYNLYPSTSFHYGNGTIVTSLGSPSSSTCAGVHPNPTGGAYNYSTCSRLCIKY